MTTMTDMITTPSTGRARTQSMSFVHGASHADPRVVGTAGVPATTCAIGGSAYLGANAATNPWLAGPVAAVRLVPDSVSEATVGGLGFGSITVASVTHTDFTKRVHPGRLEGVT